MVTGTITVSYSAGKRSEKHVNPVVMFTIDTVAHEFYYEDINYLGLYDKGDRVTVIYERNNPSNARILALIGYWINMSELFIAFIIFMLVAGVVNVYV